MKRTWLVLSLVLVAGCRSAPPSPPPRDEMVHFLRSTARERLEQGDVLAAAIHVLTWIEVDPHGKESGKWLDRILMEMSDGIPGADGRASDSVRQESKPSKSSYFRLLMERLTWAEEQRLADNTQAAFEEFQNCLAASQLMAGGGEFFEIWVRARAGVARCRETRP